jgi:Gly-Xaa carboxypeptidase
LAGAITELGGLQVAKPDVAEKGYLGRSLRTSALTYASDAYCSLIDVKIQIATPGGHSSIPPKHTSIGLLAIALAEVEANPHEAHLKRTSPLYSTLLCAAEHAPDMDGHLKQELYKSVKSDRALKRVESILFNSPDIGNIVRALSTTTQAVDLIQGGVKVNALPELATAVVNHRIAIDRFGGCLFTATIDIDPFVIQQLCLRTHDASNATSRTPGGQAPFGF